MVHSELQRTMKVSARGQACQKKEKKPRKSEAEAFSIEAGYDLEVSPR